MAGPRRSWTQFPMDNNLSSTSYDCLNYLVSVANRTEGSLTPPATPMVTTISHPNAVQIVFNEVPGATAYAIFETSSTSTPSGVPIATVHANLGGNSNSYLRGSLNDTVSRFYWVQAIDKNGNRSAVSTPAPGVALSNAAPVIPISQAPVNQGGVGGGVGGGGGIYGRGGNTNRLL